MARQSQFRLFSWQVFSPIILLVAAVAMFWFPSDAVYTKGSISAGWETGALIATVILCIWTYSDMLLFGEKRIWDVMDPRYHLPILAVMSAIIFFLGSAAMLASGPHEKSLFSVGLGLEDQLDSGRIPDSLRTAFDEDDRSLQTTASVSVIEASSEWQIHSADAKYTVRKGIDALNIHGKGDWVHQAVLYEFYESSESNAGKWLPVYHASVIVLGAAFSTILSLVIACLPVRRTAFETTYPEIKASNVCKYTRYLFNDVRTGKFRIGKYQMAFLAFMRTEQFARKKRKCERKEKKNTTICDRKLEGIVTEYAKDISRLAHEENITNTEPTAEALVNLMIEKELARTALKLVDVAALLGYSCVLATVWGACKYAAPTNETELKTFLAGLDMFIGGSVAFGLVIMNVVYVLRRIGSGVSG